MKMLTLLKSSKRWIKGTYARDTAGNHCLPRSHNAVKFCMLGAATRCYGPHQEAEAWDRLNAAIKYLYRYDRGVAAFNDAPSTTFAKIRRVVKEAGL